MNKDFKNALIVGGVLVGLMIVVSSIWGGISGWNGWGMMSGFGMGGLMGIGMLVFWGLVIWAVVLVVRGLVSAGGGADSSRQDGSALEILKQRYARGEIDREEFEQKRKDLGG